MSGIVSIGKATRRMVGIVTVAAFCILSGPAFADEDDCGNFDSSDYGGIGPWDYYHPSSRVPTGEDPMGRIKRVENVHFQRQWEYVSPRVGSYKIANEVIYTLLVFPNHPRALWTLSRLEKLRGPLKNYASNPRVPKMTVECFFDRALRFRPNQSPIWMIYGMHLHSRGRLADAREAYQTAKRLGEDSTQFHYNFGLLLVDTKELDLAEDSARVAYSRGYQQSGLKDQLAKLGRKIDVAPKPENSTPAPQ
jgi:hypothetical protein